MVVAFGKDARNVISQDQVRSQFSDEIRARVRPEDTWPGTLCYHFMVTSAARECTIALIYTQH